MFGFRIFIIKKALRRVRDKADYKNIMRARIGFEKMVRKYNQPLKGFDYEVIKIEHIDAELITPHHANKERILLYFHGGGYATGSYQTHRGLVSKIAAAAHCRALSINYRLAPEHPYPAAIEDAVQAYQWLLREGYSPAHIAFGGDSAGGGVTFGSLLYLRDHQMPLPSCAIGLSPWLDLTSSGSSYTTKIEEDPMLHHLGIPLWAKNYAGERNKETYASPIYAKAHGLCPIYIQVGDCELLYDDSITFAKNCSEAGTPIKLDVYKGLFHVFQAFYRLLAESNQAIRQLGMFIKEEQQKTIHQKDSLITD